MVLPEERTLGQDLQGDIIVKKHHHERVGSHTNSALQPFIEVLYLSTVHLHKPWPGVYGHGDVRPSS